MQSDIYPPAGSAVHPASWCYDAAVVERRSTERRTARLGPSGRLTVPKKLRERLGWSEGTLLDLVLEADGAPRLVLRSAAAEGERVRVPAETDVLEALRAAHGIWRDRDDLRDPTPSQTEREGKRGRE